MRISIVQLLAKFLPDTCFFSYFGIELCRLNPLYEEVMKQKLKNLGYK